MALALQDLPKYMVIEPSSTLRLDMRLDSPACEIDISLDNPKPGRSFVLMIGHPGGPYVQRVRLAGKARVFFDPQSPGNYVLLLSNPDRAPIVLRLRGRGIGAPRVVKRPGRRRKTRPRAERGTERPVRLARSKPASSPSAPESDGASL